MKPKARRLPRGVRPGEGRLVALCALYFFALLASYYVLRPIRDEGGVRAGVARIPWLFTATFAAMILVVPAFGWIASRVPRRRFVPGMHLFFAGNLALFAAAMRGAGAERWAGPALFVWVAVVNVFAVSVSWSFLSDLFDRGQARRLFGLVAAGGSAGAIAGPAVMAVAAPRLGHGALLLGAAGLYLLCAAIAARLARAVRPGAGGKAAAPESPIGGGALDGIRRTLQSRFLLFVVLALVCSTFVSTVLYFSQTEIVGAAIRSPGDRTALFARMDLAVNVLTILLQLFVTGWVVRRIGVGGALAAVAALVTAGIVALGAAPALATIVVLQIVQRAGHFAVGRPARETLFVSLDPEERYKAKSFIDTAVFRASDSGGAWLLTALRAHGAGLPAMAWLAVPVGLLWTAACWAIGRRWERTALPRREGLAA